MSFKSAVKSSGHFTIAKGAVVCSDAQLMGKITIGARTVVHPSAQILAEGGPIIIGDNNLIQEKAVIINKKEEGGEKTLVIGNGNVFSIASYVECASIGNNNSFEAKCVVGPNVTVSDRCVVGAACELSSRETLPPDTIIYGSDCRRYHKKVPLQTSDSQQLEYLIKVLPNYHRLLKSSSSS